MKVAVLAGGLGTRLSEETVLRPKPMVTIGGQPILWHILKCFAAYGFKEFVVALGYKGDVIKDYFVSYRHRSGSLSLRLSDNAITFHDDLRDDWTVHLLDTGVDTQTGGRVKRIANFIGREPFMLTYGDGLTDINFGQLLAFHQQHGKAATVTAARPPSRFGGLRLDGEVVTEFVEKPQIGEGWINGGFFVLQPNVVDYIDGDETYFEREPMESLAKERELIAFRHSGFWQCMDTLRDVRLLDSLWSSGKAPWKVWD